MPGHLNDVMDLNLVFICLGKQKAFEMTFMVQEKKFKGIAPPAGKFNHHLMTLDATGPLVKIIYSLTEAFFVI